MLASFSSTLTAVELHYRPNGFPYCFGVQRAWKVRGASAASVLSRVAANATNLQERLNALQQVSASYGKLYGKVTYATRGS